MNNSRSKDSIGQVIDVKDVVPGDVIRYGTLWVVLGVTPIGVEEERIWCMNLNDPVFAKFAKFARHPNSFIVVVIHQVHH